MIKVRAISNSVMVVISVSGLVKRSFSLVCVYYSLPNNISVRLLNYFLYYFIHTKAYSYIISYMSLIRLLLSFY